MARLSCSAFDRGPILGLILVVCGLCQGLQGAVVFNQIPANLDLSYISYSFAANHAQAMGNYVQLSGPERYLNAVTVTMVTWAKQSDFINSTYKDYTNTAGWNHYVEVVLYAVDNSGAEPVLKYLADSGRDVLIPWRPTVVPPGYPETGTSPYPYEGFAFNLSFQFDGSVQLPNQLVVSVNYDTQNYGYEPKGVPGPFDQLNVAVATNNPTVGSSVNSMLYQSQGVGTNGVASLQADSGGAKPLFRIEASAASLDPYNAWIESYGYTSGGLGALRNDDPDKDGLSNLTEFAFGTDPTVPSPSPISITRSNTTVTILWLQRNDGSATYTNRSTTNLTTGFPVGNSSNFVASISVNTNNMPRTEYTRYQFSTNSTAFLRHFYKVDAQVP